MNEYHLFLDECGDHGLIYVDPNFPVFVLCGILIAETDYAVATGEMQKIKRRFWGEKKVLFHSRDIRKCEKEFQILFDPDIKRDFYAAINAFVAGSEYKLLAAAINKDAHIKQYGKLADDVYQIALSFLIERAVFLLDDQPGPINGCTLPLRNGGGRKTRNSMSISNNSVRVARVM